MREEQAIMEKLERIEKRLETIQEHMVDADTILTEEERKMLDESMENEKKGRLTSSEALRKKLGI